MDPVEFNKTCVQAAVLLRMEIKQEFGCEHEKSLPLRSQQAVMEGGVKDWRVKLIGKFKSLLSSYSAALVKVL